MSATSGENKFETTSALAGRLDDEGHRVDERDGRAGARRRQPRPRRTTSHRRFAAAAVAIALTAPCGASFGASKLFKCIEGGRTVYQQQACSVTSEPAPSATVPTTVKASGAEAASATARPAVRPPSPASSASATRRR
jgi:hypothetical protein